MAPSVEVAAAAHRSHQPRHARHRQAPARRHRRADARRRPQDASRRCSARRSASRSASRSSAQALRKGGRLVFVGAGTSGRLGVLEAAEMPPTFGTNPSLVQAIMAGGKRAVTRSQEGVEDNYEEGARSIARVRPTTKDVVVGVSASGMTPFVRGALTRARKAGAKIIFVTCDPRHRAADLRRPDDRAGGRARSDRRLDAAEGRHRDQDGAQHADDRRR